MKKLLPRLAVNLFIPLLFFAACRPANPKKPAAQKIKLTEAQLRQPKYATEGLKTREGLQATLFACEPMVTNPTNMDVDARGRVWVTEAYNYRNQLNPGHPYKQAGDRILILEDLDEDGAADTAKVFYQDTSINAALGICVLGNRAIVSCSPNVFVLTDTDGDDKADKKELLFTGIGGEQHDHAIHAFVFGPDGKLYFNFGNMGDSLLDKHGKAVTDPQGHLVANKGQPYRQGMVFRCNPDGSSLEVVGHNFRNNFEVAVDAFGSLWQSDNDDDGNRGARINYVMEFGNYGYTDEMTGAGWQARRINMEDSIPYRHWHLNDPGVVPNLLQTGSGSPTGMIVYEGHLLPEVFHNQMIHGEPGHNVVRSYPVQKQGAGFTATIENIVESGQDKWFRPSDVSIAPDGSLFVADWYDPGVGGHQVGDLDRGRIYRIAPQDHAYEVEAPGITGTRDAIRALKNPNPATRYLGWTWLHAQGADAERALKRMFGDDNPRFRARALWLLSKLPGKGMDYVREALQDADEDIRVTAIRAARQIQRDMAPLLAGMADDPSPQVRREMLIALHWDKSPQKRDLWAQLASRHDGADRWYLEALGIAAAGDWDACFAAWLKQTGGNWNTPAGRDIIWRARTPAALPMLARIISDPQSDPLQHLRYFRALDFHPREASTPILLGLLDGKHPQQDLVNALAFTMVDESQLKMTAPIKTSLQHSLAAVEGRREFVDLVQKFKVRGQEGPLLEIAAADRGDLSSFAMQTLLEAGGKALVERRMKKDSLSARVLVQVIGSNQDKLSRELLQSVMLGAYPLPIKVAATRKLGSSWNGFDQLWNLVEKKKMPKELDTTAKEVLVHSWRQDVKAKAVAFYEPAKRQGASLPPIARLVEMKGDAVSGKKIYTSYCASCHVAGNTGVNFGPALTEIGSKLDKAAMYEAIIHPDAGISFGFEGVLLTLKDGSTLLGYVAGETASEVELKMAGGSGAKVKKADIQSRKAYEHSLMPTGLASAVSVQELSDLVAYLGTLKK